MTQRIAVVSGAARGIGAAVAQQLAVAGHDVALLDLDAEQCADTLHKVQSLGVRCIAVSTDVSDEGSVQNAVAQIKSTLGEPGILVNNAGVLRDNLLFKMSVSDWDMVMNVHLRGAFLLSRAVQDSMVEAGWGRIVNLSSTSALGNRGQANYAAAKAGIQGLTKTLALELGKFGVTVNAVAPGFIETDMTRATATRVGQDFEQFRAAAAQATAVQRVGTPADIANAVGFFASEVSGFVSGQVLYVAGGPCG